MTTTTQAPFDIQTVKSKQQETWGSGDYAVIGSTLQLVGELLCEAVDVSAGHRVLDVAAGNGNASLAAARRGCEVTATDYVAALLAGTAARASAEGVRIDTREADAEALPFEDGAFDAVLSTFGVMFTPDQQQAADELRRVCRPGGRIGLANWTPGGFIGEMFRIVGSHVPPPAGLASPLQWGSPERLAELFPGLRVDTTARHFVFRYRSAQDWLQTFRTYYGPTVKAFAALDEAARAAMESELVALAERHDTASDGTLRVPGEYLEIVVTEP